MTPILSLRKFLVVLLAMKENNNHVLFASTDHTSVGYSAWSKPYTQRPQRGDILKKTGTSTVVGENNQESTFLQGGNNPKGGYETRFFLKERGKKESLTVKESTVCKSHWASLCF